jgi:hypothetical protein
MSGGYKIVAMDMTWNVEWLLCLLQETSKPIDVSFKHLFVANIANEQSCPTIYMQILKHAKTMLPCVRPKQHKCCNEM